MKNLTELNALVIEISDDKKKLEVLKDEIEKKIERAKVLFEEQKKDLDIIRSKQEK